MVSALTVMGSAYDLTLAKHLESLLSEREKLVREFQTRLQKLDQLIAAYRTTVEPDETKTDIPSVPPPKRAEFKHQKPVRALESYLRARKEYGKIPFKTVIDHLTAGGADHGKPRGKKTDPARLIAHTLKIALWNRRETFGYEPFVDTFKGISEDKIFVWLASSIEDKVA